MQADESHAHVHTRVGPDSDVEEELAVRVLKDGSYRLVAPPSLTLGLAEGDVFVVDEETRRPRVLDRSGNLTIWLHAPPTSDVRVLAKKVENIGGVLEGLAHDDRVAIFTVPVAATFPVVEAIFNAFVDENPESEWYFGNVYADDGVTPLRWWEDSP